MSETKQFATPNLVLASVLLVEIPGTRVLSVSPQQLDGRKLLIIGYSGDHAAKVQHIIEEFHARRLQITVDVFRWNRTLAEVRRLVLGQGKTEPASQIAGTRELV